MRAHVIFTVFRKITTIVSLQLLYWYNVTQFVCSSLCCCEWTSLRSKGSCIKRACDSNVLPDYARSFPFQLPYCWHRQRGGSRLWESGWGLAVLNSWRDPFLWENPKHAADVYFLKHNKQFVKRDCGFMMTTGIPSPQKRYHKRSFSASTAQEYIPTAVYGRAHIPRSISKRHDTVSRDILYISASARSETRIKLTQAPPIG